MFSERSVWCSAIRIFTVAVVSMIGLVALPQEASSEGRVTDSINAFNIVFVPCANGGDGELVLISGVFYRVNELEPFPDLIEHGNWAAAEGVGQVTGDRYVVGGASNRVPAVDDGSAIASYLVNTTFVSAGPNGITFHVQQILRFAPFSIEPIRVTCN